MVAAVGDLTKSNNLVESLSKGIFKHNICHRRENSIIYRGFKCNFFDINLEREFAADKQEQDLKLFVARNEYEFTKNIAAVIDDGNWLWIFNGCENGWVVSDLRKELNTILFFTNITEDVKKAYPDKVGHIVPQGEIWKLRFNGSWEFKKYRIKISRDD
jgi:hypothetical protein